jgi:hypothetical protein
VVSLLWHDCPRTDSHSNGGCERSGNDWHSGRGGRRPRSDMLDATALSNRRISIRKSFWRPLGPFLLQTPIFLSKFWKDIRPNDTELPKVNIHQSTIVPCICMTRAYCRQKGSWGHRGLDGIHARPWREKTGDAIRNSSLLLSHA